MDIGCENVTLTGLVAGTSKALLEGFVETTVGGVPPGWGLWFPPPPGFDWPKDEPQDAVNQERRTKPNKIREEGVLRKIGVFL